MDIKEVLTKYKRVHVIGISPKKERDSNKIAHYLKDNGYEVYGIRPGTVEIDGIPVYNAISETNEKIEILDVFRASDHIPQIVDEAIAKGIKVLWLQLGVHHPEAEEKARKAGIHVISNQCILVEHRRIQS